MKRRILFFIVLSLFTTQGEAAPKRELEPAVAKPGELIIEVNGVVCSICAKGLKKNLAKLDFQTAVFTGKNSVKMDIRSGRLVMYRDSSKPIDFDGIKTGVKRGGYEVERIYLQLSGSLDQVNNQWILAEKGGQNRFALAKAPSGLAKGDAVRARVSISNKALIGARQVIPIEIDEITKAD